MTLHPDLRAMLPERLGYKESGCAPMDAADLTAFAVAVLRKGEECCMDSCGCGNTVSALARRWQEGA